jgi:AMP nucleosidase
MKKPKAKSYKTAIEAYDAVIQLYQEQVGYLRQQLDHFTKAADIPKNRIQAFYPYIRIKVERADRLKNPYLSYGFVAHSGMYETTLTRPDIFKEYYLRQFQLLIDSHNVPLEIGVGDTPIPIHFAIDEGFQMEGDLSSSKLDALPHVFDHPDLNILDDQIANSTYQAGVDGILPLALFIAPRVDLSILRLRHYTGTSAQHFQNFVIFTNYQFYIDEFCRMAHGMMSVANPDANTTMQDDDYTAFVEPGNKVTYNRNFDHSGDDIGKPLARMPQMPAYHLKRADGNGITLINIGVGPSNAKTITDHVAVLRPHAWLMLGHCAGLRNSQRLGDYALAHAYIREDHVLDEDLPINIPIPALAEIQQALEDSVEKVTGLKDLDLKKIMRTGTVATIDDRNWELRPSYHPNRRFSQSRAIALDMESATIAANGFRFRVPYGTLLCVSDKPLHGQLKLPGMADKFYRERVEQHLLIGLMTMKILREGGLERLHSRKLRSFNEVAFQ